MEQIDATLRLVMLTAACIYAGSWFGLGIAFRTYPKAVASFCLFNLGIGLGTYLVTERTTHPSFLSFQVADWLVIGGIAACRAGIIFLARAQPRMLVLALPLAIEMVATVFMAPDASSYFYRAMLFNVIASGLAISAFIDCTKVPSMAQLTLPVKLLIAWPLLVSGILFAFRAVQVLATWLAGSNTIYNPGNYTTFLWAFSVILLTINIAMVGLIVNGLLQKIRQTADTDPLTQCLNRRAFQRKFSFELDRHKRTDLPLVCVMLDLDHFKKINDQYGHSTGDAVLIHAVALIQDSIRATDVMARYGGEEFVLLMPDIPLAAATAAMDRIRSAFVETPCVHNGNAIALTASFGVAVSQAHETSDDIIKRADAAMYVAKWLGRNRVEIAQPRATVANTPVPAL